MYKVYLLLIIGIISIGTQAQPSKWNLESCIDYAKQNNTDIKKAAIASRNSTLLLKEVRLSQYPRLNFNTGIGIQAGLAIDPTTNIYTKGQALFQDASLTAAISIYNGGRLKNNVAASSYLLQSSMAEVEKVSNDVSLKVLYYYLQALAALEQVNVRKVHTKQTWTQLDAVLQAVKAGVVPELNAVQMQAQMSLDSSNLIAAESLYKQQILALKETMGMDAAQPFEPYVPVFQNIKLMPLTTLQPEDVYASAVLTQPVQKSDALKIKAAQKSMASAKGAKAPNIDFIFNLSTGFYNALQNRDYTITGYSELKGNEPVVNVGGNNYFVRYPTYSGSSSGKSLNEIWSGYGSQISNNFGQLFGFRINVPILNGGTYKTAYEISKLDYEESTVQKRGDDLALQSAIYTAYSNALSAMQQVNAVSKSAESARQAYDFSLQRYNVGLTNTLDLLFAQNNLLLARSQQVTNQYEYILRVKLLEFYKGMSPRL